MRDSRAASWPELDRRCSARRVAAAHSAGVAGKGEGETAAAVQETAAALEATAAAVQTAAALEATAVEATEEAAQGRLQRRWPLPTRSRAARRRSSPRSFLRRRHPSG